MTSSSTALLFLITTFCASPTVAFVVPSLHSQRLGVNLHGTRIIHNTKNLSNIVHLDHVDRRNQPCTTTTTRMHLFGWGKEEENRDDQKNLQENELARFSHLVSSDANPTVKFDSLSIMILEWSKLFNDDKQKMGLTTPVALVELKPQICDGDNYDGDDVTSYSGIQLLFNKGEKKTGGYSAYQDKDDEKLKKDGEKKKEEVKEGGVEVRVEQLSTGDLQVIASRCEIDEDTMVKEMSEETIIDSLRKAVAAWKKEQSFGKTSVSSPMS